MCQVRYFICPMSKNIVDSVLELDSNLIGLLPSRRQIDYDRGYVNYWNTNTFNQYVKKNSSIIIERDHSGVGQGDGDEYQSFKEDARKVDIIHIDPWKKYQDLNKGLNETVANINYIFNLNNKIKFEVGTEQTIRKFDTTDLIFLLSELKIELSKPQFENIKYVCIQSGVGLDVVNRKNNGEFDLQRLISMIDICKKHKKLSKEHNGDFLTEKEIKLRFDQGLDAINIGPEIVQLETELYLDHMNNQEIDEFYKVCLDSNTWKKWITEDFDLNDKKKLIMVCGHYNFTKYSLPKIDEIIKEKIKDKLKQLLSYV